MPSGVVTSARATEHRKCVPTDALAEEGALLTVAAPALALPWPLPAWAAEEGVDTALPPGAAPVPAAPPVLLVAVV